MNWQEIVAWGGSLCTALVLGALIYRAGWDDGRWHGKIEQYDAGRASGRGR